MLLSNPVASNLLWFHGLQHTSPPCHSPSPEVCPSSWPLHQWCHPAARLTLWRPFLLLPAILPSIRGFSNESTVITYILKKINNKTSCTTEAPPSFLKLVRLIIVGIPCNPGGRVKWLKKKNPGKRSCNLHKHVHSVWPAGFIDHSLKASQHPLVPCHRSTVKIRNLPRCGAGNPGSTCSTVSLQLPLRTWPGVLFNVDS